MKKVFVFIVLMLVCSVCLAQRTNEEYVTDQDVEIRFPGATSSGDDAWHSPVVVSIGYSPEPVVALHSDKARLGLQSWEFSLWEFPAAGESEKCMIVIDVPAMPQGFRVMEIRVRIRADSSNGDVVTGPFSDINSVKIIGRPGVPFKL